MNASVRLAEKLVRLLKKKDMKIVFTESCTGGELASLLTRFPGVSEHFAGSLVVYRDDSKRRWLGVKASTLRKHSAVSRQCAEEMCAGALRVTPEANLGISVTGYLGPGSEDDGLVYVTISDREQPRTLKLRVLPRARPTASLRLRRRKLLVSRVLQELNRLLKT